MICEYLKQIIESGEKVSLNELGRRMNRKPSNIEERMKKIEHGEDLRILKNQFTLEEDMIITDSLILNLLNNKTLRTAPISWTLLTMIHFSLSPVANRNSSTPSTDQGRDQGCVSSWGSPYSAVPLTSSWWSENNCVVMTYIRLSLAGCQVFPSGICLTLTQPSPEILSYRLQSANRIFDN